MPGLPAPHASVRTVGVALAGVLALVSLSAASCQRHGVVNGGATLNSTGGSVDVQCVDADRAKIVGFNAAVGFTGTIVVAGPSGEASIHFTNPNANDYEVAVHCRDSQASLVEFVVHDTTVS